MSDWWIVMDDKGVIHASDSEDDARQEYEDDEAPWTGDKVLLKEVARRR